MANESKHIEITEIYTSIQGEAAYAGHPCVFVRLAGCPLRCRWCDTVYSFGKGERFSIEDAVDRIANEETHMVELTGGEPLAQKHSIELMKVLVDRKHKVLIETGGSEDISKIDQNVHIIMDIKCPGSGMSDRNRLENINFLKASDEVKFVIADRKDFEWSVDFCKQHDLFSRVQVLFSAAFGLLKEKDLSEWIIKDAPQAKLNLQWHKYIWSPRQKGV